MPKTSLARRNLLHQPARTIVSIGGIGFATLLMYMQLGFLGSVGDTATNVYRRVQADIVVRSAEYLHAYDPRAVDAEIMRLLAAMPDVTAVLPLDLAITKWQSPTSGQFRGVAVLGIDLDENPLELPEIEPLLPLLRRPDHVLVDRASRADFGPLNEVQFGPRDVGRTTDVLGQAIRIVGTFEMGTGLAANGAILVSREGFARITPGGSNEEVSLIFVRLAEGEPAKAGAEAIRKRLGAIGGAPAQASVLTLDQAISAEKRRWYFETPIGIIFAMGVALAVVVGGVICYMVLASDVIALLPEYATLKAMGYGNGYLTRTLFSQAWYLALISLPPATIAAVVLYRVTSAFAGVPIRMSWQWVILVTVLSLSMCTVAGAVAVRKLANAEPASLF